MSTLRVFGRKTPVVLAVAAAVCSAAMYLNGDKGMIFSAIAFAFPVVYLSGYLMRPLFILDGTTLTIHKILGGKRTLQLAEIVRVETAESVHGTFFFTDEGVILALGRLTTHDYLNVIGEVLSRLKRANPKVFFDAETTRLVGGNPTRDEKAKRSTRGKRKG